MAASLAEADRVVGTWRSLGVTLGAGDMFRNLAQSGDPYFKVSIGDDVKKSDPLSGTTELRSPKSFEYQMSDETRSDVVNVEAWDSDPTSGDD